MSGALRYNAGKAELSYLLDLPKAAEALAKVFAQGAIKYRRGNYKLGGKPDEEYLDAALRHVFAARQIDGSYDPDTGCLHLAHAIWNLAALIELNFRDPLFDPAFDQTAFEAKYVHRPAAV